uniref:Yippee domain-containing protein n=1 Tax=Theropithecus gelada TaxID=9565 RepID=A0A8D2EMX6_THEGE
QSHGTFFFQSFQGSQGRAYLFNSVIDLGGGGGFAKRVMKFKSETFCPETFISLFFFKEHAFESSQKYKEGKFIIELAHMIKDNGWE